MWLIYSISDFFWLIVKCVCYWNRQFHLILLLSLKASLEGCSSTWLLSNFYSCWNSFIVCNLPERPIPLMRVHFLGFFSEYSSPYIFNVFNLYGRIFCYLIFFSQLFMDITILHLLNMLSINLISFDWCVCKEGRNINGSVCSKNEKQVFI